MKLIMENWRNYLTEKTKNKKQRSYKGIYQGLQPSDPNIGLSYQEIAINEMDAWKALGDPRHGDRSEKWKIPIAKYWASIKKGFMMFVPRTLAARSHKGQLYGPGKSNPMWSAAFIQYCMLTSRDPAWLRINGTAGGTISNHNWYWMPMFNNTLKLQSGEDLSEDDWIYIPVNERDQTALRKMRNGKIKFLAKDIGYPSPKPGDLLLIVLSHKGRTGYHGDIMTTKGRVGGNTGPDGGKVASSTSPVAVILTKDAAVKQKIKDFIKTK